MSTVARDKLRAWSELLGLDDGALEIASRQLARFERFCSLVTTVEGDPFELEPFQRLILLAYFAGFRELLILVPKGNGKTTLLAALAVYHLLTTRNPEAYIGASTKDQAAKMYEEARRISQLHPAWRKRLIPRPSTRYIYVGRGAAGGFLRVLASDKLDQGSLEGLAPTLGLIDELHAHTNPAIYAAVQGALHKRRGAAMLTISTAGGDEETPLGRIRRRAHAWEDKIAHPPIGEWASRLTIARSSDNGVALFEWALDPQADDPDDMATVKLANPASFVTVDKLRQLYTSPSMERSRWLRYHCGIWAAGEGKWLDPQLIHACATNDLAIPPGEPVVLGYDHAKYHDHAALVALRVTSVDPEGKPDSIRELLKALDERAFEDAADVVPVALFEPDEEGGAIPTWKVKQAIREACERWRVVAVGYDKLGGFQHPAEELADEGVVMVPVSMAPAVWAPLTAQLRAAFRTRRIRVADDPDFLAHLTAGEVKESEHGERLHGRIRAKVDALIALGIAWYVAFNTDALDDPGSVYDERELVIL